MRVLIQRVLHASCRVDGKLTGAIEKGFCVFSGFEMEDTKQTVEKMARKVIGMRIFEDGEGKMNRSLQQVDGKILSISQFTLYADCRRGNRPSFIQAARPEYALELYTYFNDCLKKSIPVEQGIFGADMKIDLCNDGPVTIWLDDKDI